MHANLHGKKYWLFKKKGPSRNNWFRYRSQICIFFGLVTGWWSKLRTAHPYPTQSWVPPGAIHDLFMSTNPPHLIETAQFLFLFYKNITMFHLLFWEITHVSFSGRQFQLVLMISNEKEHLLKLQLSIYMLIKEGVGNSWTSQYYLARLQGISQVSFSICSRDI